MATLISVGVNQRIVWILIVFKIALWTIPLTPKVLVISPEVGGGRASTHEVWSIEAVLFATVVVISTKLIAVENGACREGIIIFK